MAFWNRFWDGLYEKAKERNTLSQPIQDNSEKGYRPYFSLLTDEERVRAIKSISPITETGQVTDIQLAYGVRVESEQLVLINYRVITEKISGTEKMLYHRHFIVLYGERYCNAHYTSDNEWEAGELIYSVPEIFTKDAYAEKLYAGPLRAAMSFYRLWPMHKAFEKACKEKQGVDVSLIIKATRIMLHEDLEKYVKEQKLASMLPQLKAVSQPENATRTQSTIQSAIAAQPQTSTEKPVQKPVRKGPDIVAQLNREKEYVLALCDRLEAKYGKAEFGAPATENVITQWEEEKQITIPEDLKEWLKFSGESKLKGIPLEFYPIAQFRKEQDYVAIGRRENTDIGFLIENGRYIGIEDGNRKNLGQMETILRFWGYDAKELFAEEELEKLRPVIEEYTFKMEQAEQNAKVSSSIKDAMEYFFAKHTIGSLKKWRTYPKCPVRRDIVNCGLVISEPDRDGYYQWKPVEATTHVDFKSMESKLGFSIHQDIKDFVTSYYYFMLGADIGDAGINIYPFLPTTNVEKYILDSFEKESYAGDYEFILNGQFFQLGGGCIGGDDSFIIEVNNKTGEVLAVEYMDKRHVKIADSLYDLFMKAIPEWYEE